VATYPKETARTRSGSQRALMTSSAALATMAAADIQTLLRGRGCTQSKRAEVSASYCVIGQRFFCQLGGNANISSPGFPAAGEPG
jgi:hypothetical protein